MTTLDFARVRKLVELVHDLPREQRSAALERECGSDLSLRAEVEEVLRAADAEPQFLTRSRTLPRADELLPFDAPEPALGARIADFKLVRRIASGGMGTVWEAEQESPQRRVALKTMRFADGSRETVRRFRHEADILARLRHPNVAQVFASGIHLLAGGESVPWYALEFVEDARSVVEFARERNLPLRARLELFTTLCDAVQHGHERGVIHRDLKPSNVLVDARGTLKVIDFGVARVREAGAGLSSFHTEAGRIIGTLQYMSPEQVSGASDVLDTRSDVYALGVMLYELVTDELPYDLARVPLAEAARRLAEHAPPRPSSRAPSLADDVDAIVLKALEKDRDRRYSTADALAQDVRRYLRGDPVEARPPSVAYHLRVLTRRHAALVTALACVLVTLVCATVVSLRFAWKTSKAEKEAVGAATDALAQRDEARFREYTADIAAAYGALRSFDVANAHDRLESCPEELRGFEWWYLKRRLDRSLWSRVVPSYVSQLVWIPGTERFAVCCADSRASWIELRDASNGDVVARSDEIQAALRCALATRDGTRLLATFTDGSMRSFDARDLCVRKTWKVGEGVAYFALDPSESLLATSDGPKLSFWNWPAMTSAREVMTLKAAVSALEFSPDREWLAVAVTAPAFDHLELMHLASGEIVAEATAHSNQISDVAFSPDGSTIASASYDHDIRVWQTPDLAPKGVLYGHADVVFDVAFDASGTRLASAGWDRTVRVWEVASARMLVTLTGHSNSLRTLAWSPDDRHLVSGDDAQEIRYWDPDASLEAIKRPGRWNWRLAFWPDGERVLAIHGDRAEVFGQRPLELREPFDNSANQWSVGAPSPDGELVALGDAAGQIVLWSSDGSRRIASAVVEDGVSLKGLTWSPDGQRVATSSRRGRVQVFDRELCPQPSPAGERESIPCLVYSPSGAELLASGYSGRLRCYDARTGALLRESERLGSDVRGTAWSPDGTRVAAALNDMRIVLWNAVEGRIERELAGHSGPVDTLAFTPDGARLVSGSHDRSLRLWDMRSGREVAAFTDHTHWIYDVAVSPDGTRIVTGSSDATLRVWDAGDEAERLVDTLREAAPLGRAVRAAIEARADLEPRVRARALELASELPDDPREVGVEAWQLARSSPETCPRALELARLALAFDPDCRSASYAASLAATRLDRAEEALSFADGVLARDPNDARASTLRAFALVALGRDAEAKVEYEAATQTLRNLDRRADYATLALLHEIERALGLR